MHKIITTLNCRLCQKQQQVMVPMYGSTTSSAQQSIPAMVCAFVGSEVERYDRLPKCICQMCYNLLVESHQFSLACRSAWLKLVQPQPISNSRCLVCDHSLNEEDARENTSACQRWGGMSISDMIQKLSGTVKRIKNLQNQNLGCISCLQKMDRGFEFKNRCLESEANWLQKVAHPWEKMEVDKHDSDQLIFKLSAEIVREQQGGHSGMGHCSVCLLEIELDTLDEKCTGCLLPFRNTVKKSVEKLLDNEVNVLNEIVSDDSPSENESNAEESDSDSRGASPRKNSKYERVKTLIYRCCVRDCYNNHSTEDDLNEHYELVHGGSNTRERQESYCEYCETPFPNKSFLLDHRKHHRIQYHCRIDDCKFTRASEVLILLHCNENPHRISNSTARETLRKNNSIRKNLTASLDHFEVIGSQDEHTDILKRKSEFCCRCFALFKTKEEREAHCRAHGVQKDFPMHCEVCGLGQLLKAKLIRHQNMRNQGVHYYCRTCDKILWMKVSYSRHRGLFHFPREFEQQIRTERNDFIICCGCYETFTSEAAIQAHRKEKHSDTGEEVTTNGNVKCDKCQTIVKNIAQHDALNERQVSYVCRVPDCAFRSNHKDRMKTHLVINIHRNAEGTNVQPQPYNKRDLTQPSTYICCICPTHTEIEYDKLIEHGRTVHGEKRDYNKKAYNNRELHCPVCLKGFDQQESLLRHQRRIKSFFCSGCDKYFYNTEKLSHITCNKKVKCELCKKLFASEHSLKAHLKNVHSEKQGIRKRVCFVCGKMVKNLQQHITSHENQRMWECNVCHARFNTYEVCAKHQRVHDDLRKFACRQGCDKRYKSSGDRDRHEKQMHLGIMPFGCDMCESSFVRERDLRLHMLKHTGQKLYPCNRCGTGFDRKIDFDEHVKVHTGQRRIEEEC